MVGPLPGHGGRLGPVQFASLALLPAAGPVNERPGTARPGTASRGSWVRTHRLHSVCPGRLWPPVDQFPRSDRRSVRGADAPERLGVRPDRLAYVGDAERPVPRPSRRRHTSRRRMGTPLRARRRAARRGAHSSRSRQRPHETGVMDGVPVRQMVREDVDRCGAVFDAAIHRLHRDLALPGPHLVPRWFGRTHQLRSSASSRSRVATTAGGSPICSSTRIGSPSVSAARCRATSFGRSGPWIRRRGRDASRPSPLSTTTLLQRSWRTRWGEIGSIVAVGTRTVRSCPRPGQEAAPLR